MLTSNSLLLTVTLLALAPTPCDAQQLLGGGGGGGTPGCPVDMTKVRLDSSLTDSCDPARSDFCEACLCDAAERLYEAGYTVEGPEAVPFRECAIENLSAFQEIGISITTFLALSSRCKEEPPCVKEYAKKFAPPSPATTTTVGAAAAATDENIRAAATEALHPALAPPIEVEKNFSQQSRKRTTIIIVVVPTVVLVAVAVWLCLFLVLRERRRKVLAAKHEEELDAAHADGVNILEFNDIACVLRSQEGCCAFWNHRGRGRNDDDEDDDDDDDSDDDVTGGRRILLSHVSGRASRGQLLGLLGPSGAGKSTLLKIIAGRLSSGLCLTAGLVSLDGIPQNNPKQLSRVVAFVPQEDTLLPFLSVFETVMFSAALRLPWFLPTEVKREKVLSVLEELGLSGVSNSRVGVGGVSFGGSGGVYQGRGGGTFSWAGSILANNNSGGGGNNGVSGGERRRTCVAMELVNSPGIIALDEPTSGLDAAAAASMIFTLRALATGGAGRIVITSVHQPSPRAFRSLDRVLLLARGGRTLWWGSPEAAEIAFAAAGLPCGSDGGYRLEITEHILEVASCPEKRDAMLLATASDRYGGAAAATCEIVDVVVSAPSEANKAAAERRRAHRKMCRSPLTEIRVLFHRSAATIFRDPNLLIAHFAVAASTALILGCLYLDSPRTLAGFQNRAGALFFSLVFFGLASQSAADRIAAESHVRRREIRSGYYSPLSYIFATVVMDLAALRAVPAFLYAVVLYFMMGLRESAVASFYFLALLELFVACTALLCSFISLASPSPAVSNLVATFTLLLAAMFGGFLVNVASIPSSLRWLQWLSVYKYAWGGMLANEMDGQQFLFDTEFEGEDVVVVVSGQTYLNTFSLSPQHAGRDAAALSAIFTILAVASWVALTLRNR